MAPESLAAQPDQDFDDRDILPHTELNELLGDEGYAKVKEVSERPYDPENYRCFHYSRDLALELKNLGHDTSLMSLRYLDEEGVVLDTHAATVVTFSQGSIVIEPQAGIARGRNKAIAHYGEWMRSKKGVNFADDQIIQIKS